MNFDYLSTTGAKCLQLTWEHIVLCSLAIRWRWSSLFRLAS